MGEEVVHARVLDDAAGIHDADHVGMFRDNAPRDFHNWAVPVDFINKYRRLNREWGQVSVPVGSYPEYQGFKGL